MSKRRSLLSCASSAVLIELMQFVARSLALKRVKICMPSNRDKRVACSVQRRFKGVLNLTQSEEAFDVGGISITVRRMSYTKYNEGMARGNKRYLTSA
jgi:hypothetical protein